MKVTAGFKPVGSEEPAKRSALLGCDLHACSMCQYVPEWSLVCDKASQVWLDIHPKTGGPLSVPPGDILYQSLHATIWNMLLE